MLLTDWPREKMKVSFNVVFGSQSGETKVSRDIAGRQRFEQKFLVKLFFAVDR